MNEKRWRTPKRKRRERIEYHVAHPSVEHTQSIHPLQTFIRFKYTKRIALLVRASTCWNYLFTTFRYDPLAFGIIIRIYDVICESKINRSYFVCCCNDTNNKFPGHLTMTVNFWSNFYQWTICIHNIVTQ